MKSIIFIAPPAAGKGTHSELLKKKFGYLHISTGNLLREIIATASTLGREVKNIITRGDLVPDEIVIEILGKKLEEIKGKPFIIDGFPRTLPQAEMLNEFLEKEKINYQVIYLDLSEDVAIERALSRLTCECGKTYNLSDDKFKPKKENICDVCGKKLIKRTDDNELSFRVRYNVFMDNMKPILDFYREKNKLKIINVNRASESVQEDIFEVIK